MEKEKRPTGCFVFDCAHNDAKTSTCKIKMGGYKPRHCGDFRLSKWAGDVLILPMPLGTLNRKGGTQMIEMTPIKDIREAVPGDRVQIVYRDCVEYGKTGVVAPKPWKGDAIDVIMDDTGKRECWGYWTSVELI